MLIPSYVRVLFFEMLTFFVFPMKPSSFNQVSPEMFLKIKSIHVFTLNQTFGCTLYLDSSSSCSTPIHVSLYSNKAHKQGLYPTQNVHQLYGQLSHGQLGHFHTMLTKSSM